MQSARDQILAIVNAEIAEMEAADAAVAAGLAPSGNRQVKGASVVYSIRLAPGEVRALERRAAAIGVKPTVLARNLVRCGLRADGQARLQRAVDRLEAAVREVRDLAAARLGDGR